MKPQLYLCAGVALGLSSAAFGQANFNGSYSQNFDGLVQTGANTVAGTGPHLLSTGLPGSTNIDGWYGANNGGSGTGTEFRAQDGSLGSSAGRGVISFGLTGSSDRALGGLATSNQIPSFGVVLVNISGQTFQSLDVSFIGEQWRVGDANIPNILTFKYGFGTSLANATNLFAGLNFNTPNLAGGNAAANGNDLANQASLHDVITNLN